MFGCLTETLLNMFPPHVLSSVNHLLPFNQDYDCLQCHVNRITINCGGKWYHDIKRFVLQCVYAREPKFRLAVFRQTEPTPR